MKHNDVNYFYNKLHSINLSDLQKYQLSKLFTDVTSEITENEEGIIDLINNKQDNLVDNVNIITINGQSLLTGENVQLETEASANATHITLQNNITKNEEAINAIKSISEAEILTTCI